MKKIYKTPLQYLTFFRKKLGWLFLLFSLSVFSQKEANIWYFGNHAGLDFNSGSPVALTNGQLVTDEGCATISDSSGNLLFYTDGSTIYNKNHVVMLNGAGLMGNYSSSQSATIVPKPGSGNLFYVFTLDYEAHPNGFRYSVIDMNLDSGKGGVVPSEKNILILTPTLENLGITKHANGIDYWVMTHGDLSNTKYSYLLTSTGLSTTPVISNIGTVVTYSGFYQAGFLKFSPSGTKLAMTSASDFLDLYDFDNNTGIVSNYQNIYTETGELYGVEFSPNEQLLYVSNSYNSTIYQFNLAASNITNSKIELDNNKSFGALQIGPDNKIYVTDFDRSSPKKKISVINNPDVVGIGCGYQYGVIDLAGKEARFGLPAFNQSFFNPSFKVDNLCLGNQTHFTLNSSPTITSILWNFGDGSTSTAISPYHQYATAGTYSVTVAVTTVAFGTITKGDSVVISAVPTANALPNKTICGATGMLYDLTQHNASILGSQSPAVFSVAYFGSLPNLNNHSNILPTNFPLIVGNNIFYAKVFNKSNPNCFDFKSFTLTFGIQAVANTPNNLYYCDYANDNKEYFNLTSQTNSILGSQTVANFTVSYHFSMPAAVANINPLPSSYQNANSPQTIYVRLTSNQNPACYDTTFFTINLYQMPVAAQPTAIFACDDASNDGKESFNLAAKTPSILGTQNPADFTVSYHFSQPEANSGANPLPATYINATAWQQTVYVRVVNNLSATCFEATKQFNLVVQPKPQLVMDDTFSICEGTYKDIDAPLGFSTYEWKDNSTIIGTQPTIRLTAKGIYSLKVTKNYGTIICSDTKNFTVYNSNKAKITKIDINDWTDSENTIEVFVTGDGDYQYSLDNTNFQDSPIFTGLGTGQYTVYVDDKKGCGFSFKDIFLLIYPKFFSPNGDGINDYWKIKFSEKEPNQTVKIFDRFGTLIKELRKNSYWNGTDSSNNPVISDDYWFVVSRQDGTVYKGHFSLIR